MGTLLDGFIDQYTRMMEMGVEIIKDRRYIYMGYVTAIHGHELGRGQFNPVSPARGMILKAKECSMVAHWHQSTTQRGRSIRDRQLVAFSLGCMCDLHPNYAPVNDWQVGFATFERTDADGGFIVQNKVIINGQVV